MPEVIFWWAAALVLVVSFVALAALWPKPRLQDPGWRPLPGRAGRVLASRPVEIVCGAIGIFLFALTIYAGLRGHPEHHRELDADLHLRDLLAGVRAAGDPVRRRLPGVQPVAGDRPGGGVVARTVSRSDLPEPLAYPDWLGRWPAAAGIFGFATHRAGLRGRRQAENLADRGARLLGDHVHRDGALRGGALDRPRRGVLGLLQPVLAHLRVRDAGRRGRSPQAALRAAAAAAAARHRGAR